MWEYNYTDEMYTGRFDRSEKIFHSDVYLGQEFSDGLYHWKYIKRERRNGRWVYYYNDEAMNKAQTNAKAAKSDYNKYSKAMEKIQEQNANLNSRILSNNQTIEAYNRSSLFKRIGNKKKVKTAVKDNENIKKQHNELQSKYSGHYAKQREANSKQKTAEYEIYQLNKKDKVKKAVSKQVAKGLDSASKTQHNLSKKINKGKKAIAKLFKKKKKK